MLLKSLAGLEVHGRSLQRWRDRSVMTFHRDGVGVLSKRQSGVVDVVVTGELGCSKCDVVEMDVLRRLMSHGHRRLQRDWDRSHLKAKGVLQCSV